MKLNCDLGEGLDAVDRAVIPHIHMANIACGGHAGDRQRMLATIEQAQQHQLLLGAHPSYPDRENFGRLAHSLSPSALRDTLESQVDTLLDCCAQRRAQLAYIKPHGALYHALLHDQATLHTLLTLARHYQLPLMVQALPDSAPLREAAASAGVNLLFEAFADRAYRDDGQLVARGAAHAVHTSLEATLTQARLLTERHGLFSEHGRWLDLRADSLCVHSDSPTAVATIRALHRQLSAAQAS